jgi:hypothetical protein
MRLSQQHLLAAPLTMRIRDDLQDSEALLAAPASMPYDSHARKMAQYREDLRRRGRSSTNARDTDAEIPSQRRDG